MRHFKLSLAVLALATFAVLGRGVVFAEVEKAVIKIEGGMQCSL